MSVNFYNLAEEDHRRLSAAEHEHFMRTVTARLDRQEREILGLRRQVFLLTEAVDRQAGMIEMILAGRSKS